MNKQQCIHDLASVAEGPPSHVEQAHRQVEQALQTADQQIEALQARVTKKNAQLSETKLRLEHLQEHLQDGAVGQRHHLSSLLDTGSSEHTGRHSLLVWHHEEKGDTSGFQGSPPELRL